MKDFLEYVDEVLTVYYKIRRKQKKELKKTEDIIQIFEDMKEMKRGEKNDRL